MLEWICDAENRIVCWPVNRYFSEGGTGYAFSGGAGSEKYHQLHGRIETEFKVCDVVEPEVADYILRRFPNMDSELCRSMMIIASASRT